MKQIHKAKRHRGSADGRQEPLALDPRDPDIVHAHRIARRGSPGTGSGAARSSPAARSSRKKGRAAGRPGE